MLAVAGLSQAMGVEPSKARYLIQQQQYSFDNEKRYPCLPKGMHVWRSTVASAVMVCLVRLFMPQSTLSVMSGRVSWFNQY